MILPIYTYGQPVLRKEAEDITPDYPGLKDLIDNMFETMVRADGVGLAAPQVGLPIRLVVVTLDPISDDYPEYKDFNKVYINPYILEVMGDEVSMDEGCLSLPGIHESVKRGSKVHVKYMDENFVEHDEVVEGYLARVMQHEFDHLDGVMFIDHLSTLRKQMIKGKLNTMLKGKARSSYKMKQVKG
jgi:peptide deformylase